MEDIQRICVWPDYEWCYVEDVEELTTSPCAKSDDYRTVTLVFGDEPTEEQLAIIIGDKHV